MSQILQQAFHSQRAGISIVDYLADEVELSKAKIKDCLSKGGVWIKRLDEEPQRVKMAKTMVKLDDEIHIYYDEDLLKQKAAVLELLDDQQQYSVWMQPEGVMAHQSLFSDHLSLESVLLRSIDQQRDCYLMLPCINLSSGLLLVVHTRNAAAKIQQLEEQMFIHRQLEVQLYGKMQGISAELAELLGETVSMHTTADCVSLTIDEAQRCELDVDALIEEAQLEIDEDSYADRAGVICTKLQFTCPMTGEPREYSL